MHPPSVEELNAVLARVPLTLQGPHDHEAIREALVGLAEKKELVANREFPVAGGRVDLVWQTRGGLLVAAFEIDRQDPRRRSLRKLGSLSCACFLILRSGRTVTATPLRGETPAPQHPGDETAGGTLPPPPSPVDQVQLLADLVELGVTDPQDFLGKFALERVSAWVKWVLAQPKGRHRNPAGFIFRKLEEGKAPPELVAGTAGADPRQFTRGKYGHVYKY